ncbi:MAG TPA: hypothetical protein VIU46_09645 [Gallionellaceae bacterium]
MIKRQVILIISFSGIFGIILGVLGVSLVWLQTNATFPKADSVARTEASIVKNIALLEHLRSGRYQDATRQVEAWLDNDLVGAGEYVRAGGEFSVSTVRAIESERKARQASGYEPENERINAAVQATFRQVAGPETETHARSSLPLSNIR